MKMSVVVRSRGARVIVGALAVALAAACATGKDPEPVVGFLDDEDASAATSGDGQAAGDSSDSSAVADDAEVPDSSQDAGAVADAVADQGPGADSGADASADAIADQGVESGTDSSPIADAAPDVAQPDAAPDAGVDSGVLQCVGGGTVEIEPNNSSGTATVLSGTVCGTLTPGTESDFLKFTLKAATTSFSVNYTGNITITFRVNGQTVVWPPTTTPLPFVKGMEYSLEVKSANSQINDWRVTLAESP